MRVFQRITSKPSRAVDAVWGSGQFGAARKGHLHQGLDILATAGESIVSPIEGDVVREKLAYTDSTYYRSLLIRGRGEWAGYDVKMLYVQGRLCGHVMPGEVIGIAQDITLRYPGIPNHVHVEVRGHGLLLNPMDLFGLCF